MEPQKEIIVSIEKYGEKPIVGKVCVDKDIRLSDYMNHPKKFIAVKVGSKVRIINKDYIAEINPV